MMKASLLLLSLASTAAFKVANAPVSKPDLLKLRGGFDISSVSDLNLLSMIYYGGFGVTLYADPEKFYGKDGIVPYDAVAAGPIGTFRGRAFGAAMTAMAAAAYIDRESSTVLKMFSVASILMLPLMASNTQDDNFAKEQWKIQIVVHAIVTALQCKTAFA